MYPFVHRTLRAPSLMILLMLMPHVAAVPQSRSPLPEHSVSGNTGVSSDPVPVAEQSWKAAVEQKLDLMGHRNWILVVDKAFPEQSSPGMTYVYVDQGLVPVLEEVLGMVAAGGHVSPVAYRDLELNYLSDKEVPGIESLRSESDRLLSGHPVRFLLHEEVFSLLDESSSLFTTLVIKTNCTLPYTSVFLQLDCAYWSPEDEKALRERMDQ